MGGTVSMGRDEGIAALGLRAQRAIAVLWVYCAFAASGALLIAAFHFGFDPPYLPSGLLDTGQFVAMLVAMVLTAMWIYRAHANLAASGVSGLHFSPGWAVGCYFIPFINLIKPFDAMKELWNASMNGDQRFDSPAPPRIKTWWFLWLGGNAASNAGLRMLEFSSQQNQALPIALMAGGGLALAGAAWYLLGIIRDVTAAQRQGLGVGEVFA